MKNQAFAAFLFVSAVFGVACFDVDTIGSSTHGDQGGNATTSSTGGQGGSAGSESSSSVASSSSSGTTLTYCNSDADCDTIETGDCARAMCNGGKFCEIKNLPLAAQCDEHTNPDDICDGRGNCGEWMPYGGPDCYAGDRLPWSVCPFCDDGDPATLDECKKIGGLDQCTHSPLPEGYACGPSYTVQSGKCCPRPDTTK